MASAGDKTLQRARRMGDVEFEALKVHFDQLPQHFGTAPSTYRGVFPSALYIEIIKIFHFNKIKSR